MNQNTVGITMADVTKLISSDPLAASKLEAIALHRMLAAVTKELASFKTEQPLEADEAARVEDKSYEEAWAAKDTPQEAG